jgi:hypothetical protein
MAAALRRRMHLRRHIRRIWLTLNNGVYGRLEDGSYKRNPDQDPFAEVPVWVYLVVRLFHRSAGFTWYQETRDSFAVVPLRTYFLFRFFRLYYRDEPFPKGAV